MGMRGGGRRHPGTIGATFTGTPTRGLHARGAVAPDDYFRMAGARLE
jgi:hypothetical protein